MMASRALDNSPETSESRRDAASGKWMGALRVLAAPLLMYSVLAGSVLPRQLDRMNPDAVAYVRRALYLSQGDFKSSVSGYWSPMISWSIAPLLKMGVDGLHAARFVLFGWGMV